MKFFVGSVQTLASPTIILKQLNSKLLETNYSDSSSSSLWSFFGAIIFFLSLFALIFGATSVFRFQSPSSRVNPRFTRRGVSCDWRSGSVFRIQDELRSSLGSSFSRRKTSVRCHQFFSAHRTWSFFPEMRSKRRSSWKRWVAWPEYLCRTSSFYRALEGRRIQLLLGFS